jgi:penicillin-binding protein 1B
MVMAAMYQTIAAGGFRTPLRSIRDIVDAHGQPLRRYSPEYDRSVSLQAVQLLHYAMLEVMKEGTGRSAYQQLPQGFAVAGKTGTTNDGRDSWFAGFSGDLLAVAWIGRDDNGGTGLTGSSGALKLWSHFMARASERPFGYRMAEGMQIHYVDGSSGYLTGKGCENAIKMPFITGSEPGKTTGCVDQKRGIKGWFESLFK